MTYLSFLTRFLVIPILILSALAIVDSGRAIFRAGQTNTRQTTGYGWLGWGAVLLHVGVAVLYTTPWDNYLVATGVWWYDPHLVAGVTLGWVPLEEYLFFVLQTFMIGLWLLLLRRRLISTEGLRRPLHSGLRALTPMLAAGFWFGAVIILVTGWEPGTYLALELAWALPPITLQLAYGADILWHYRRLVALTIVPFTFYLSAADTLAMSSGTWTVNPQQSVGVLLGGVLPVEELLFFLLTNTLIAFGVILVLAPESRERIRRAWMQRRIPGLSIVKFSE
jgi:lycopene cyclase domain-containing protein